MPHDIFISYSRRDLAVVKPIKEELESAGFSCWMDLSDIPAGEANYKRSIIPAIRDSRIAFLFFLSERSQASENALKEIGFAEKQAKKRIVLIQFNDDAMTDDFFYDYQNANIIDWRKPEQKAKLIRDLKEWSVNDTSVIAPSGAGSFTECPVCGKKNHPENTFRCHGCGRDGLCLTHRDETTFLCKDCMEEKRREEERRKAATDLVEEGKRLEETDAARAAECFRKAADLGDQWACWKYGDLLCNGWYGVAKDVSSAFGYYQKADPSVPWVQHNLGSCHLEFFRQTKNPDEARQAVEWLRKSAEAGIPWACVKLGDCCRDGFGVPQDFAQAASWYGRVAGRDPDEDYGAVQWAEWCLGNLYRNGQGVERDLDKALGWYRKSAARKGDAADCSAVAAAEVYSELLSARIKPALGSFWTSFREVAGVRMKDARGRIVPLAGLVASDRGIFIGLSLDGLRIGIADPLPDENPVPAFVSAVSEHCGLPMDWISGFVVVPDSFRGPGAGVLPPWAIRESEVAAGLLSVPSLLDWAHVYRDVIRKLETLDMSSSGAETNALFHFTAPMPEWEDGAALLDRTPVLSGELLRLAVKGIVENPSFAESFPWRKLDGKGWAELLAVGPQFADRCPWEKLDGADWARLLSDRPQFADRCPWEKLDGADWARLLSDRPQFADRCPWSEVADKRPLGKDIPT